jgi:ankyrin repeat protein
MGCFALPVVTIFFVLAANAAPGDVPSEFRATVNAESVPVHPETSNASEVLKTLNKGDMVTIGYSVQTGEGEWCSLSGAQHGYTLCVYLTREAPLQPIAAGAPMPTVLTQSATITTTQRRQVPAGPAPAPPASVAPVAPVAPAVFSPEQSALVSAAKLGNVAAIQLALQKGAIAGGRDKEGKTALLWAASMGRATAVTELLSAGSDVNAADNLGWTPLEAAVWARHPDVVQLLLDQGAEVNARDSEGRTPLMHAAQYGDLTMIAGLLAKGADPNARNRFEQTPLMFAVALNDTSASEALLAGGADVNARDAAGRSVLINAVLSVTEHPANVQLLLRHAADVHVKDTEGRTALAWAVKKGHTAVMQLLKKAGASTW